MNTYGKKNLLFIFPQHMNRAFQKWSSFKWLMPGMGRNFAIKCASCFVRHPVAFWCTDMSLMSVCNLGKETSKASCSWKHYNAKNCMVLKLWCSIILGPWDNMIVELLNYWTVGSFSPFMLYQYLGFCLFLSHSLNVLKMSPNNAKSTNV